MSDRFVVKMLCERRFHSLFTDKTLWNSNYRNSVIEFFFTATSGTLCVNVQSARSIRLLSHSADALTQNCSSLFRTYCALSTGLHIHFICMYPFSMSKIIFWYAELHTFLPNLSHSGIGLQVDLVILLISPRRGIHWSAKVVWLYKVLGAAGWGGSLRCCAVLCDPCRMPN